MLLYRPRAKATLPCDGRYHASGTRGCPVWKVLDLDRLTAKEREVKYTRREHPLSMFKLKPNILATPAALYLLWYIIHLGRLFLSIDLGIVLTVVRRTGNVASYPRNLHASLGREAHLGDAFPHVVARQLHYLASE